MRETAIVSAVRTPFGRLGGALKSLQATDLGGAVISQAVKQAGIDAAEVEHALMGMVLQGGAGQAPARQATRKGGLGWNVPSETINKVCASGLRSVTMADQMMRSGDVNVVVAGGMESMSNAPYLMKNVRSGLRMGHSGVVDLMTHDGLTCAFHNIHMAAHGASVASEYDISREEQDEWSVRSQQLAWDAIQSGRLAEEIVPVEVARKKEKVIVETDEGPRPNTTLEILAKLPPIFTKDGTVTAGNAPGVNDGAGAMVLMEHTAAEARGVKPLATILGHACVGADAPYIATAPGLAIQKLLNQKGMKIDEVDLFEINEAFAAVVLVSGKITGINYKKVNVNGGAIAFGHPIGASGARILMTLIHELRRRGGGLGVAAICSGAAQGDAVLVRVD